MSETTAPQSDEIATGAPAFSIVGDATPEQVAALSVVLAALGGGDPDEGPRRSGWSDPGNVHGFRVRRRRPAWRSWANR